ncbi:MAG: hypothetical protein ACLTY0_09020, partial [Lachnospiraceae bacterium]
NSGTTSPEWQFRIARNTHQAPRKFNELVSTEAKTCFSAKSQKEVLTIFYQTPRKFNELVSTEAKTYFSAKSQKEVLTIFYQTPASLTN